MKNDDFFSGRVRLSVNVCLHVVKREQDKNDIIIVGFYFGFCFKQGFRRWFWVTKVIFGLQKLFLGYKSYFWVLKVIFGFEGCLGFQWLFWVLKVILGSEGFFGF